MRAAAALTGVLLYLAGAVAGCAAGPDPETARAELLAADRAFAQATAENGIEGWLAWFADDGAMTLAGVELRGHAAIREAMTPLLSDPASRLVWDPVSAEASPDATLGYTTGRYRVVRVPGDSVLSRGTYVTVWRRTPDGWKVVMDIGNMASSNEASR